MTNLVNITKAVINNSEVNSVLARELHSVLESKQDFSTWIKNRIKKYDFVENVDWIKAPQKNGALESMTYGQDKIEYIITLDVAKELSMVENNAKGREARRYFIECENKLKNEVKPMSQIEALLQSVQLMVDIEHRQKETESNVIELQEKVKELEYKAHTSPNEFYTISGYASLRGIKVDVSVAGQLGKKATKLSKEWDYPINKAHSEIFGQVNVYHVDVLNSVFESA